MQKKPFSPWPYFLLGMGLLFGYFGICAYLNKQPSMAAPVIFVIIIVSIFVLPMLLKYQLRKRLQKEGIPATATLLSTQQTGTYVNNQPEMDLAISVRSTTGETWQTSMHETIPLNMLYAMSPGATFPVLYDRNDKNKVVFDNRNDAGQQNAAMSYTQNAASVQNITQIIMDEQARATRLRSTGTIAAAKILTYSPLITVNGNNPFVSLLVEVMPENEPVFNAQVKGVIAAVSIPLYQPGNNIYVRYNPGDKNDISLSGSKQPDSYIQS